MKNINHLKSDSPALQLVDCETLATRYGVSEKFIRKKTAEGFFGCVKLSRRCVRWDVAACDRIIAEYRINANSEA
jgi:hypothetical protein